MKKIIFLLAFIASIAHAREPSVLLFNATDNRIEYSKNANEIKSIASITKIMTAMVALDYNKDLDRKLMLSNSVRSRLPRQEYTREQLLNAMLINSDNAAAETIAQDYPGGRAAFIAEMNFHAHLWGMTNTHFNDPSGLGVFNTSTVHDVTSMLEAAKGYWFILDATNTKHMIQPKYKKKSKMVALSHTSGELLSTFDNVTISKTGLTNAAGWCVAMVANQNNKEYIIVVLGSKTKRDRLVTVKNIMSHKKQTN